MGNLKIYQIDKRKFKKALGIKNLDDLKGSQERKQLKDFPYRLMFAYFLAWFAKNLQNDGDIGDIICDSRHGADKNMIDTMDFSISPDCTLSGEIKAVIKNRCAAICFAKKSFLSGSLELTDLLSFVSFFRARKMLTKVSHLGLNLVWKAIKSKMEKNKIIMISEKEVRKFFGIAQRGVHKYLKTKS